MDSVRKRPPLLRALGDAEPPEEVEVGGERYRQILVYKHDSWAATGLYGSEDGRRIVCKFNRQQPVFGLPMTWLGRFLGQREARFLHRMSDIEATPDDAGKVFVDGREAENAVARVYVEGAPLYKGQHVADDFFDRLRAALVELHRRGIVYNDLHKKENVIVGEDGRPYLVDFQVSSDFSGRFGRSAVGRAIRTQLAAFDLYHLRKHVAHCRPDTLSPEELAAATTPPRLLRMHRKVARPLRHARRKLLVALGVRAGPGHATTEVDPEDAVRREIGRQSEGIEGDGGAQSRG